MPQVVPTGIGNYDFTVVSFSESTQLNTLIAQVTNLTTITAKEATLLQTEVDIIAEVNGSGGGGGGGGGGLTLAQIEASTVLAKEATSQAIKTKVNTLENTDLSLVAKETTLLQTEVDIIAEVNGNETKIDTAITKIDTKPTLNQIEGSTVLTKTTDLQKVNRNVIKASKLIPANETI
jgi:hypothetical protein